MVAEAAWADRLERRWGFLAAPGLPGFLAGMTALAGALSRLKPEFIDSLALSPGPLRHGQVWRVVTFLIMPPPMSLLLLAFWVLLLYSCLSALEAAWGAFKLALFLALSTLATAAGALALGAAFDNWAILLSSFLAFARLAPEREMLVFFVLPVKLRWLAALAAFLAALQFVVGGAAARVQLAAGLSSYLLFFGPGHWRDLRRALRGRR